MKLNKRFAIICLLILCVGTLWTTGALSIIVDGIEYTAKGLFKAFKYMNEAASAYYNIQQLVDDLQDEFVELEAKWKVSQGVFTQMWNIFMSSKVLYEAAVEDMWAANSDYKNAKGREILANSKIVEAESRIKYCRSMLDVSTSSEMAAYWKDQLAQAEAKLREGKSERTSARQDKADANKRFKDARFRMNHHEHYCNKWERDVEIVRRERDAAKEKMDAKADEVDVKMGEEVLAGIENDKADAEYKAYKAGYYKQKSGEGDN